MSFAVHGTAELSFTGAPRRAADRVRRAASARVRRGRARRASCSGCSGCAARERDSVIGVVLAFGLGLGVLFLALYHGRASNKFGLLDGVDRVDRRHQPGCCSAVRPSWSSAVLAVAPPAAAVRERRTRRWPRPAACRCGRCRCCSRCCIGLTTALAVPIVGAILVLSVMIAPGAAAAARSPRARCSRPCWRWCSPRWPLLGGTVLSLAPGLPVARLRRRDRVRLLRGLPGGGAVPRSLAGSGLTERTRRWVSLT